MLISCAKALPAMLFLLAFPAAGTAQDARTLLQDLRQTMGTPSGALRVTGAGSDYLPASDGSRRHVRLQSYTQEIDLGASMVSERVEHVDATAGGDASSTDTRRAAADSPWSTQYLLWTTPHGFLAGVSSGPHTVAAETLFGRPYQVVTMTAAGGREVRGYVNDDKLLERTRTEFDDPTAGTVRFEAIYRDWRDFDGVKYPSVIIQRENDELSRIVIVDRVQPAAKGVDLAVSR